MRGRQRPTGGGRTGEGAEYLLVSLSQPQHDGRLGEQSGSDLLRLLQNAQRLVKVGSRVSHVPGDRWEWSCSQSLAKPNPISIKSRRFDSQRCTGVSLVIDTISPGLKTNVLLMLKLQSGRGTTATDVNKHETGTTGTYRSCHAARYLCSSRTVSTL